jgi:hypothetical protein
MKTAIPATALAIGLAVARGRLYVSTRDGHVHGLQGGSR